MAVNSNPYQQVKPSNKALKAVASTLGVLVGLAGIEHGLFELLQGNVATNGLMINAIGPSQQFWEYGTEPALSIVPIFLATGLLSIVLGSVVTAWAFKFVNRRYGASILLLFSALLWLVGGGFAPIFMAIFAVLAASQISKPLNWWSKHLSIPILSAIAKVWPWSLAMFVIVFLVGVEIAIFGYPLLWFYTAEATLSVQNISAIFMVILMPISVLTALARDTPT